MYQDEVNNIKTESGLPKGNMAVISDIAKQLLDNTVENEKTLMELRQENLRLREDLHNATAQKAAVEAQYSALESVVEKLQKENQELRKSQPVMPQPTAIQKGFLMSTANELPAEALVSSENRSPRNCRQLDWVYFDQLVESNNKMSELNNDRAKVILTFLYRRNIINDKFRLQNNLTDNVAAELARIMHEEIPTETKWSIFEKLFRRNNLRTHDSKEMTVHDRKLCRQISEEIKLI